jgi:hypothetical protein
VREGGQTDNYVIVLNALPFADVTIHINAGPQLTATPSTIIFTRLNWYIPRNILVTAKNDVVVEGSHFGTITHTATSTDNRYHGKPIANLRVTIQDNDTSGAVAAHAAAVDEVLALQAWEEQENARKRKAT